MAISSKEFFITKLSFKEDENLIKDVFAYEYDGESISDGDNKDRQWMVDRINNGSSISIMTPNANESKKWLRGKAFEYIKQLIQNDYLADTTVLVVLIGAKTKCRMHVDWEISGALNLKVGDGYSGLLGLFLPTHPNFGSENYIPSEVPKRLAENIKSGYAIVRDWTDDRVILQEYLEKAFARRNESNKIVNKAIPQMDEDTCD